MNLSQPSKVADNSELLTDIGYANAAQMSQNTGTNYFVHY